MSAIKILQGRSAIVADDSRTAREIVVMALGSAQVNDVRQAADGGIALRMISERCPDFVILDIEMPHDGISTLGKIRAMPHPERATPVLIMTAHASLQHIATARDAGANGIITKPLSVDKILSRVVALLVQPRPFIEAPGYMGPDRRQRSDPGYSGPFRRAVDTTQRDVLVD